MALRLTLAGGEVYVETSDDRTVEIELVPLRDNDITRQAIAEARVEMTDRGGGHEIVVQVPKKPGFLVGRDAKVGIRVRCPHGSGLGIRSSSAGVDATGLLGAVDVKTASGDISLEDARVPGRRQREQRRPGARRRRPIDIRTASGDASVRRSGGILTAKLVSGDIAVGEAAAGLAVTTVSGDVRVHAAGGGGMRVQAVSGDVHLAIKPGERLYIDANSVSGTMSSDLGLQDAPPIESSTPVVELRVRTVSGDVNIVRATTVDA